MRKYLTKKLSVEDAVIIFQIEAGKKFSVNQINQKKKRKERKKIISKEK